MRGDDRTARSAGRILAVGHMRRFFPVSSWTEPGQGTRLGAHGFLSDSRGHTVPMGCSIRRQFSPRNRGRCSARCGGSRLDPAVVVRRSGQGGRPRRCDGGESNARISLEHAEGFTGEVVLSRDWNLREQYFIQFEDGWISFAPYASNRLDASVSPGTVLRRHCTKSRAWELSREQANREPHSSRRSFISSATWSRPWFRRTRWWRR